MRRILLLAATVQALSGGTVLDPAVKGLSPVLIQTDPASAMAGLLTTYIAFCKANAKPQYYVDCLSERFAKAAQSIAPYSPYADLRRALQTASKDLSAIAAKYSAAAAPKVTPRSATLTASRPLRAITPENRAVASAAATSVIDSAQLVLLRSADKSPDLALPLRDVAQVLGTSKVLLRAA